MPQKLPQKPKSHTFRSMLFLLFWLGMFGFVALNQQAITDWWKLRGYSAPSEIAAAATGAQMSEKGMHLFYVNKPEIKSGKAFTNSCPIGFEKSVVLGCYKGGDNGIYLYQVTDSRLQGVVEVTAAHEMLHAAYERLSTKERMRIDGLLTGFYKNGLTDERIKKTVDLYRQTEPNELPNEMHSIFASEVRGLPAELETYYARYFTNRQALVAITEKYQAEFTTRRTQVEAYDSQLKELKGSTETLQTQLETERQAIDARLAEMAALKKTGNIAGYNAQVTGYNKLVDTYNAHIGQLRDQITYYNDTVEKRNALALEERELTQALSATTLPAAR